MSDDFGLTPSTAGSFDVRSNDAFAWTGKASGHIEVEGDLDGFLLDVEEGQLYVLLAADPTPEGWGWFGFGPQPPDISYDSLSIEILGPDGSGVALSDVATLNLLDPPFGTAGIHSGGSDPTQGTFSNVTDPIEVGHSPDANGDAVSGLPVAFRAPYTGRIMVEVGAGIEAGLYSIFAHQLLPEPLVAAAPVTLAAGDDIVELEAGEPTQTGLPPTPWSFSGQLYGHDYPSAVLRRGEPVTLTMLVTNAGEADAHGITLNVVNQGAITTSDPEADPPSSGTFSSVEATDLIVGTASVDTVPGLTSLEISVTVIVPKDSGPVPALAIQLESADPFQILTSEAMPFRRADEDALIFDAPSHGTAGADDYTILFSGGRDVRGGAGDDTINGGIGDDTILGHGDDDTLRGGAGDDILSGGTGRDWLEGGLDDDTLSGGADRDVLIGGDGDDRLSGGGGADYLDGGAGNNKLAGGSGADAFVFALDPFAVNPGVDRIVDFDAEDGILIHGTSVTVLEFAPDWWRVTFEAPNTSVFSGPTSDSLVVHADPDVELVVGVNVLLI